MLRAPRGLLLFALLAAGCDLDFDPHWEEPVDAGEDEPLPEDGEGELDAAQGVSEPDDAGAVSAEAMVAPALLGCRAINPCDGGDGGDAGCARICIANCGDVPCLPNQMCYREGLCSVPCGWCIDLAPPIKARH